MGMRKIKEIIEVYEYCPHSQDCDCDACPYYSRGYPHCYYRLVDDAMSCLKAKIEVENAMDQVLDRIINTLTELLEGLGKPKDWSA